jgi:hypothetical protein
MPTAFVLHKVSAAEQKIRSAVADELKLLNAIDLTRIGALLQDAICLGEEPVSDFAKRTTPSEMAVCLSTPLRLEKCGLLWARPNQVFRHKRANYPMLESGPSSAAHGGPINRDLSFG